jgi:iron-sulfur cluster repair protein YtfE (RIC family)
MGKASRKKQSSRNEIQFVNGVKLSDALLEICEEYYSSELIAKLKKHELEELLNLIAMAWNIASVPQEDQSEKINHLINTIPNMKEELESDKLKEKKLGLPLPEEELSDGSIRLSALLTMIHIKEEKYPNEKLIK